MSRSGWSRRRVFQGLAATAALSSVAVSARGQSGNVEIMMVGDIILELDNPDGYFDLCRNTLQSADLAIGHLETVYSLTAPAQTPRASPLNDPAKLAALSRSGFDAVTLAANHVYDRGPQGISDTIVGLRRQGIAHAGAGMNIAEAERPADLSRGGARIGLLSFNAAGPPETRATADKAGCAYVEALSHYQGNHRIGAAPRIFSFVAQADLENFQTLIERAKAKFDVLIVAIHKGTLHTPAVVEDYERLLGRAAIDAGADVVVGHHAHILRGIDVYKGKPIFHGLGNFVCATEALTERGAPSPEMRAWAVERQKLYGFTIDPEYPTFPFHPEARNVIIATCTVSPNGQLVDFGFVPCWTLPTGQPQVLRRDAKGEAVADYVRAITTKARLNARFTWKGDRVSVSGAPT